MTFAEHASVVWCIRMYSCKHGLKVIGCGWVGCSHKAPKKEGDIDTPTWYMDSVAYLFPYIAL